MSAIVPAPRDRRENLPGLLARAVSVSSTSRAAEILEAKKLGELALHLAKVTNAAKETHADCLRIITRAEIRMADEIDKGRQAASWRQTTMEIRCPNAGHRNLCRSRDRQSSRSRMADSPRCRRAGCRDGDHQGSERGREPTKAEILETAKEV